VHEEERDLWVKRALQEMYAGGETEAVFRNQEAMDGGESGKSASNLQKNGRRTTIAQGFDPTIAPLRAVIVELLTSELRTDNGGDAVFRGARPTLRTIEILSLPGDLDGQHSRCDQYE
jgi:hypothetical protein